MVKSSTGVETSTVIEVSTVAETSTSTVSLTDPVNEYFFPDVDLSDKPWFKPDEELPAISVEIQQNVSIVLASIPISTKQKMGHSLDDMLQECIWNGYNCGPQ